MTNQQEVDRLWGTPSDSCIIGW